MWAVVEVVVEEMSGCCRPALEEGHDWISYPILSKMVHCCRTATHALCPETAADEEADRAQEVRVAKCAFARAKASRQLTFLPSRS